MGAVAIRVCGCIAFGIAAAVVINLVAAYLWASFQDGHEFPY